MEFKYCKIEIFIPEESLSDLQKILQKMDAGHIGNYDSCLSFCEVTGCWRPLEGSSPYKGGENELCFAKEYKVEVVCKTEKVEETIRAIKSVHPYEEPVINAIPLFKTGL